MSDRSEVSRALLQAARGARPSAADRERLRSRFDARLAVAAAAGASVLSAGSATAVAATAAKAGAFGLLFKIGLGTVLAGSIGAGVYFYRAKAEAPKTAAVAVAAAPSPVPAAPSASASAEPAARADATAAADDEPPPDPEPAAEPRRGATGAGSTRKSQDAASIAAEVALLRKAQGALNKGDAEASLRAIDALAAKHADGALREERMAARVLALCAAGRVDEARAEGQRFVTEMPHSVQAARVRSSCAFAKANAAGK